MQIARFITDFADQAVMLPLVAAIALALAFTGWLQGAGAWAVAAAFTWGAMLALKLAGIQCGALLFGPELTTPSGHTATASLVYGGLAALAANKWIGRVNWALPCAFAVAAAIGATRIVVGAHTAPEVVIGGAVGIVGALVFVRLAGPPPETLRLRWAACAAAVIMAGAHGIHLPAERVIRSVGSDIWPLSLCAHAGGYEAQAGAPHPLMLSTWRAGCGAG